MNSNSDALQRNCSQHQRHVIELSECQRKHNAAQIPKSVENLKFKALADALLLLMAMDKYLVKEGTSTAVRKLRGRLGVNGSTVSEHFKKTEKLRKLEEWVPPELNEY